jgi:hypothetical protein
MIFFNLVSTLGMSTFAVYFSNNKPNILSTVKLVIAGFSILVGIIWLINAEVHRSFQNRHVLYLEAIEEILVGEKISIPHKIYDGRINRILSGKIKLIWAIRIFVAIYTIFWILLVVK